MKIHFVQIQNLYTITYFVRVYLSSHSWLEILADPVCCRPTPSSHFPSLPWPLAAVLWDWLPYKTHHHPHIAPSIYSAEEWNWQVIFGGRYFCRFQLSYKMFNYENACFIHKSAKKLTSFENITSEIQANLRKMWPSVNKSIFGTEKLLVIFEVFSRIDLEPRNVVYSLYCRGVVIWTTILENKSAKCLV